MNKRMLFLTIMIAAILVVAAAPSYAVGNDGYRYSAGLQWMDPVGLGISGTVDLADWPITVQGILGSDDFPSPVVRGLWAFWNNQYVSTYVYGGLGLHTYDYANNESDTDLFVGVGAGLEWNWQNMDTKLPPIFWSLELGFTDDDFGAGLGIHYAFNL